MVKIRSCLISITDSVQLRPQWFTVNSGCHIYTINMEWHLTNSCIYFGHHTFCRRTSEQRRARLLFLFQQVATKCFLYQVTESLITQVLFSAPSSVPPDWWQWAAADWLTAVSFPEDNNYQTLDTDSCQALFLMLKNLTLTTALYFRYPYHPPLKDEYTIEQES